MATQVILDADDSCIGQEPFSARFYPGESGVLMRDCRYSNVMRDPHTGVLMLAGGPDPSWSTLASAWTLGGTGAAWDDTDDQPRGGWGAADTTKWLHMTKRDAMSPIATRVTPWPQNMPMVFDFYFYEPASVALYQVEIAFGERYVLYLYPDKAAALCRRDVHTGSFDTVAEGELVPTGLFNEHFGIAIRTSETDQLIITSGHHPKGIAYTEPEVEWELASGVWYRNITFTASPYVRWSSGEALLGCRPFAFAGTGYMLGPVSYLPYDYTASPAVSVDGVLFSGAGQTITASLVKSDGSAFTAGENRRVYRPKIVLTTTDTAQTPQIHWASFDIAATSATTVGTNLDVWGETTELTTSLAIDGELECSLKMRCNSGNAHVSERDWLSRRARVVVDGIYRYDGYLGDVRWEERQGGEQWLSMRGKSRLKRLDDTKFWSAKQYDGWLHTTAVADILANAGLEASEYTIASDTGGVVLPSAVGMAKPLCQPQDGSSIREFLKWICENVSGWVFYASATGHFWYIPRPTTYTPELVLYSTTADKIANGGLYTYTDANCERHEEDYFNQIIVVGMDNRKRPLFATYNDPASRTQRDADDFVGILKRLIVCDPALCTLGHVEATRDILALEHGIAYKYWTVQVPAHLVINVGACLTLYGQGNWVVQSSSENSRPGDTRTTLQLRSVPA